MKRIEIVDDGDLILIVYGHELCVYCNVLCMLSQRFKAILAPDLAGKKPTKLEVDAWPDGMKLLCLIAHQQTGKIHGRPKASEILELVDTAAEYDCIASVDLVCEAWFSQVNMLKRNKGHGDLLEAAITLDNAKYFTIFTEALVFRSDFGVIEHDKEDELQSEVVGAIVSRRDSIYNSICERLTQVANELVNTLDPAREHFENNDEPIPEYYDEDDPENKVCDFWKGIVFIQLRTLSKARLWPPQKRSATIEGLYKDLKAYKDPKLPKICTHDCEFHEGEDGALAGEMNKIKDEVAQLQPSLCLDCFNAEGKAKTCRVPHKKLKHY